MGGTHYDRPLIIMRLIWIKIIPLKLENETKLAFSAENLESKFFKKQNLNMKFTLNIKQNFLWKFAQNVEVKFIQEVSV